MELTTIKVEPEALAMLFMMSKIQNQSTEYRLQSAEYRVVPYAKIIPTVGLVG